MSSAQQVEWRELSEANLHLLKTLNSVIFPIKYHVSLGLCVRAGVELKGGARAQRAAAAANTQHTQQQNTNTRLAGPSVQGRHRLRRRHAAG